MTTLPPDEARKLIIRSVTVQDADMDEVFQLPATTWIGGKVRLHFPYVLGIFMIYSTYFSFSYFIYSVKHAP